MMAWDHKLNKAIHDRHWRATDAKTARAKRPFDVTIRHQSPPTRKLPSMGNVKARRQPSMPRMPWEGVS